MIAGFLQSVMEAKRRQMSLLSDAERESVRAEAIEARRSRSARFREALLARPTAIIAEFKRHSPSAGAIRAGADPVAAARLYHEGGAAAISVLTEPEHFRGSLDDLRAVASAVNVPLLRKDFLVDRHQVFEAALAGAEAVLVIVAGLNDADALKLLDAAHLVHLDALVEVHTAEELRRAVALGATLIGVNNRNLATLKVDLQTSLQLAELSPAGATLVSESGLRTRAEIERLQSAGFRAFLIGESLMRAGSPVAALRELQGAEPVQIKICGITRVEDALAAIEAGASMIGLNFFSGSPRCVTLPQAQKIAEAVAGRAKLVGVFVNEDAAQVISIARAVPLDLVQLHGDESAEYCREIAGQIGVIRALRAGGALRPESVAEFSFCRGLLLDTPCEGHGGSGRAFEWTGVDWNVIRSKAPGAKLFLAGGLSAANVAEAIAIARPDVVDVCSGVESAKGVKSVEKIREFVAAVRAAEGAKR
jgi:indole-3-glycerol phosphate synthase/phosphoribosylanthranilate isomerase